MTMTKTTALTLDIPVDTLNRLYMFTVCRNGVINNSADAAMNIGMDTCTLLHPETFGAKMPVPHPRSEAMRLRNMVPPFVEQRIKEAFLEGHRFGHVAGKYYANTPNDPEIDWTCSTTYRKLNER